MADLMETQAAGITKVVGSDATGAEQTPIQSTASGGLHMNLRDATGAEIAPATSALQTSSNASLASLDAKVPVQSVISTGTITAVNQIISVNTTGMSVASLSVTGTFVGQINIRGTSDGVTFFPVTAANYYGWDNLVTTPVSGFLVPCGGYTEIRAQCTILTSGTIGVHWNASAAAPGQVSVFNTDAKALSVSGPLNAALATTASITTLSNKFGTLGQQTMVGSAPVTIASNQTAIPMKIDQTTPGVTNAVQVVAALPTGSNTIGVVTRTPVTNVLASGTLSALNSFVEIATDGLSAIGLDVNGTFVATATVYGSATGGAFYPINHTSPLGTFSGINQVRGDYIIPCSGFKKVRIVCTAYTSGSISITMSGSVAASQVVRVVNDSANAIFTKMQDGAGSSITSQANGVQRALDVGVNVAGVQVDPRLVTLQAGASTIGAISNTAFGATQSGIWGVGINSLPAITKGAQSATGITTQDLKDSGRVKKMFSSNFAAATIEGLISLTPITDGVAGTAATTFTVTAGKRLRIQSISLTVRNVAAAQQSVLVHMRQTNTGAVATTSPLIVTLAAASPSAVANIVGFAEVSFPDGMEFSGTEQIGVSQVGTATLNNVITIIGYEY